MNNFGIVIIDKDDKSQYNNVPGIDKDELDDALSCFNQATTLTMGAALVATTVSMLMSMM